MKKIFVGVAVLLVFLQKTEAREPYWGATGHRTIGEIAEKHLSKKTKKKISELLQGQGLALVSTFGDDIKSDDNYDKFYNWHFVNFPFGVSYEDSEKNEKGDIVMGINHCIKILKDPDASKEDQVFYLKFLVHLIGDLHQPLHVGRAEDKGGNDIKLLWHYKKTNLHRVWDSDMIDFYNMSYTELAENAAHLSKAQIQNIQQGTILDWTNESQNLAKQVYASVQPDDKLGYRYSYLYFETVRSQIQKSGLRLAKVLNDIYG
jgi:hypothetical protein